MLNTSLFLLSFDELKNILLNELTISHVAIVYVLMYVVYKTLGRYVYFKPQEHASKVNRTFLALSLFVVLLQCVKGFTNFIPFLPDYRWLFELCWLIILVAPVSIIIHRIIWKYDDYGRKNRRNWHYDYLPIIKDYYKTNISKSESNNNSGITSWEEEGVESTTENIHSDVLLNILALIVFIIVGAKWAYISSAHYNLMSYLFFAITSITISGIFIDRTVFSWIKYTEKIIRTIHKKRRNVNQ